MTAATVRTEYPELVVAHRQQTARLHKVEQLARCYVGEVGPCNAGTDDQFCFAHREHLPCPFAELLERARDLGLVGEG